ncbi:MAG TPA: hypothetical protein VKN99_23945 [Polyangia bacterium]|nr:hypothetical protein [Polyangia bacterium]
MTRALVLAFLALASCAEFDSTFRCASDFVCTRMGSPGTCEPSGFCSFRDSRCASGRRFDEFAGQGLGGQCVGAAVDGAADRTTGRDADIDTTRPDAPPPDASPPDAPPPDAPDPCAMVSCPGGTCMGGVCCQGCWIGNICLPGTTPPACGSRGVSCATCGSGELCNGDNCFACADPSCSCGQSGSACCATPGASSAECSAGFNCILGRVCLACGAASEECCLHGNPCNPPLTCVNGTCG